MFFLCSKLHGCSVPCIKFFEPSEVLNSFAAFYENWPRYAATVPCSLKADYLFLVPLFIIGVIKRTFLKNSILAAVHDLNCPIPHLCNGHNLK